MKAVKHIFPGTYGLVLCGGESSRMGTDKSLLQYYDKAQRYHLHDMLLPFCEKVLISCNTQQANSLAEGYAYITDETAYSDIGPMAALLSAFALHPQKNLLLIACDYPFLTATALQGFTAICKHGPAAFFHEEAGVYEPMLAWYPFNCLHALRDMYHAKQFSLQHFLKLSKAVKYSPPDINCIKSIDTPEAFNEAYKLINAG